MKVATQNMLLGTEVSPEDTNFDTEDIIEENKGLTQQISTVNPSPTLREVPGTDQQGTDSWPWLDEDEVSNPEYPEQQNDSDNNPGDNYQIVSNNADDPEVLQSHNDNPDDTGYPDTQTWDRMVHLRPMRRPRYLKKVTQGLKRPPRVDVNQGGLKMMMWGLSHVHTFWMNF